MGHSKTHRLFCFWSQGAFTLVEVLLALSIIAVGLVALLHLLASSILTLDSANCLSQATLIADAKVVEATAADGMRARTETGAAASQGGETVFEWRVTTSEADIEQLEEIDLSGLHRVDVTVSWNEGQRQKQLRLSRYIFADEVVSRIASNVQNSR